MPTPPPRRSDRIAATVGNERENRIEDVLWAKEALACLGRYRPSRHWNGYIDRILHDAIHAYQRDRGLRRDGYINPDGETERAIFKDLSLLAGEPAR